jgi:signal transduction histidine kinase
LKIKDFGKGFDSSLIKKGNGLDNMQHRAADINGTIKINSSAASGTELILSIPL